MLGCWEPLCQVIRLITTVNICATPGVKFNLSVPLKSLCHSWGHNHQVSQKQRSKLDLDKKSKMIIWSQKWDCNSARWERIKTGTTANLLAYIFKYSHGTLVPSFVWSFGIRPIRVDQMCHCNEVEIRFIEACSPLISGSLTGVMCSSLSSFHEDRPPFGV